jgi:hypothetical protein
VHLPIYSSIGKGACTYTTVQIKGCATRSLAALKKTLCYHSSGKRITIAKKVNFSLIFGKQRLNLSGWSWSEPLNLKNHKPEALIR